MRHRRRTPKRSGMTLTEVMVASSMSLIVILGITSTFIWSIRTTETSRMYAWAEMEAVRSIQRIAAYMRTSSGVSAIDQVQGHWVELSMPDGTRSRFAYTNATGAAGAGEMLFLKDLDAEDEATSIVLRGLTEVMSSNAKPIFQLVGGTNASDSTAMRVAFRITQPLKPGDAPVEVETSVYFRNR